MLEMIATLEKLGDDRRARINARVWAKHYRRLAKKMGIKLPNDQAQRPALGEK